MQLHCNCASGGCLVRIHRKCRICSDAATVPPAVFVRIHRTASFAARPQLCLRRRACPVSPEVPNLLRDRNCAFGDLRPRKLHIPRPAAGGRPRPFRCSSSPNCKRSAGLQFGSVCLARKSRQKDSLGDALYCALTRANFWPLRGLNALFGRRFVTIPMVFTADECTTRSCG